MSIDYVLQALKINLASLSKMIGYDLGLLSKIYRGQRPMTLKLAYKLSKLMDVHIDKFYKESTNDNNKNSTKV